MKSTIIKSVLLVLVLITVSQASAVPGEVDETGTLSGINAGFGDRIGEASRLNITADGEGILSWELVPAQGEIDNENAVVIYLDTDGGESGFAGTPPLTDTGNGEDLLRAAVSGRAVSGEGAADLIFAGGFKANFAVAFNKGLAVLYQLQAEAAGHRYVATISDDDFGPAGPYRFKINLADLGLASGASIRFVATYLDPVSAYRSNEFIGVAESSVPDQNIETKPHTLKSGDFAIFQTATEPE